MVRSVLAVGMPLCVALSLGGLVSMGAVFFFHRLGMNLSDRQEALPVVVLVVLFGSRGALESANRLGTLIRRGALHSTLRR